MELKKFRELVKATYMHPMANVFAERLGEHGEVQIGMKNEKVYSIHQGDMGVMESSYMIVQLDTGELYTICYDAIATLWTHLASEEKEAD